MIHIHTALDPARAETYIAGRRLWAEATEPHETMADVLAHIAELLLDAGLPAHTLATTKAPGRPCSEPGMLGCMLAVTETPHG